MTQEAQDLLRKALSLPESERAELAGSLIASLDSTIDSDADAAWQEEISRRAKDLHEGKVHAVPWDEVQRKARTLLHGQ